MHKKIVISGVGSISADKAKSLKCEIACALGVLEDDLLLMAEGVSLSVLEIPAELAKAKETKDAHDKAEAEKAAHEKEKAEKAAAKAAEKAEAKAEHDAHKK